MSESAYDISYLLEAEQVKFSMPASPLARTERVRSASAVTEPDAAAMQAATARELLSIDGAHEDWIRQYLQISSRGS
jgi:hypothetical protein